MTGSGPWTKRLGSCLLALLLIIPLALYLALRANALDPSDGVPRVAETGSVSRTTEQVGLAGYEPPLRLMVWPHPLVVLREVSVAPFWLALTVPLALLAFALLKLLRGSKAPLLGLSFFYLAILPSSRIVSDSFLPPILMGRMLYLPAIGLTICLAAAFLWLGWVISPRSSVLVGALAVLILLPVAWIRNEAWGNELTLLEHDFEHEKRSGQLLSSLLKAYSRNGQNARALRLCEQYSAAVDVTPILLHDCAGIYSSAGLNGRAESLYLRALELDPSNSWDRFELARLYVCVGRADDARAYFRSAIENEGMAFVREIMQAIALIELYPDDPGRQDRAAKHLERALALQPRPVHARQLLDQLEGAQRNPRRD